MGFSYMFDEEKDLKDSILDAYKKWKRIFHKKKFDIEKKKSDFAASLLSQQKSNEFYNLFLDVDALQTEDLKLLIEFIFSFIMIADSYDDKTKYSGKIIFD